MNNPAVERAKEIVRTDQWGGNQRANMTKLIGAGRVLAKRVELLELTLRIIQTWASCDASSSDTREKAMADIVDKSKSSLS